ncbi:formate dehydrogenase protein fdhE [Thermoproteus uzoniensis 768-20]|uniref:Formate dehydrogenase protein fdhE n=1 Tax=Thermoproteus uzoniensis (strain 768-20) TaxID=999630 RepID=F2L0M7_THEU7|nr:formate dehydrogenase accessory protein FdhE [Thermoproteus uzoniensis]AEA12709.1 formate dehydrogenase protein fdhE [Thermoproteus uzoniensis 768-20]
MSREAVLEAVCGGEAECREELMNAPREVESFLGSFSTFTPVVRELKAPLVEQVENLSSAELMAGDRELARLAVARRLAELYGEKFRDWAGDFCPICGRTPVLFLVKREQGPFFETAAKLAKCVCGFSWRYAWWRCPNCGAEGRENFDVLVKEGLDGVFFYRCRKCGYVHVEASGEPDEVAQYGLRILARYVAGR